MLNVVVRVLTPTLARLVMQDIIIHRLIRSEDKIKTKCQVVRIAMRRNGTEVVYR